MKTRIGVGAAAVASSAVLLLASGLESGNEGRWSSALRPVLWGSCCGCDAPVS
jgi:hypothetical protein